MVGFERKCVLALVERTCRLGPRSSVEIEVCRGPPFESRVVGQLFQPVTTSLSTADTVDEDVE